MRDSVPDVPKPADHVTTPALKTKNTRRRRPGIVLYRERELCYSIDRNTVEITRGITKI